ncbi:hypothetical protein ABT236_16545 [Streptomyces sp. NPDC001523]|uniref:hypothetical protein n=1 Tax=Streptomyces sp. NPDC001523 TaxID=3154383 RepID=UPI003325135F
MDSGHRSSRPRPRPDASPRRSSNVRSTPPGGHRLAPEAFQSPQSPGLLLGTGGGSHRLHHLPEDAFVPALDGPALSDAFPEAVHGRPSFAGHPSTP